jgi:molybdopterin/thiamine biosynthesis adenylyltransferase
MIYFSLVEKESANGFVYQEKLKTQHIAIFGVGGWGSWVALNLCSVGIGKLTLVDGERIEGPNLNRQILYSASDIGDLKVTVAAKKLKIINPYISINTIPKKVLPNEEELEEIIDSCTFIVLAWTNLSYFKKNTVEYIIHEIAYRKNIPVLEIGADPLYANVGPLFVNDGCAPCFECIRHKARENYYSQDSLVKSLQDELLRNHRKNLNRELKSYQNCPSLSIMGGLAADQIIKFTTKCEKPVLVGTQFKLNLQSYEATKKHFIKYENCKRCSKSI